MTILLRANFAWLSDPSFGAEVLKPNVSPLKQIFNTKTLRVGTTGDYRPFSYLNPKTHQYEGIDIDLASSFANALGVKIKFIPVAWQNLMLDYQNNRFDIALSGISKTPEREKIALFSVPYSQSGKTPIVRCEDKNQFDSIEKIDRSDVMLIVNPGGTNQKFAMDNIRKAKILIYPDNNTIFQQIVDGYADVMITDSIEVELQSKLQPRLCASLNGKTFDTAEKAILMQNDAELKKKVDSWLEDFKSNGSVNNLFQKYIQQAKSEVPLKKLPRFIEQNMHKYRNQIDALDFQILDALNQRAKIAKKIGAIKSDFHLPIRIPKREKEIIQNLQERNVGPLPSHSIEKIWDRIMTEMRKLEESE